MFAFVHICSRLLAFLPLRLLDALVSVCLRLFAFARICLRSSLLRPPLRDTDLYAHKFKSQPASTRCDLRPASPTRP